MEGEDWQNQRMEVTYEEARSVLEAQNDTMSDIDTKAMRTVRFNVLLLGVLLTAGKLAGPSVFHTGSLYLTVGSLVGSALLGMATYNESDLFVGSSGTYIETLADGDTDGEHWDRDLLKTFAGMISKNADEIDRNSWLLTTTQATLAVGIIFAVISVLI